MTIDFWRDYLALKEKGVHFCEEPREEEYGTGQCLKIFTATAGISIKMPSGEYHQWYVIHLSPCSAQSVSCCASDSALALAGSNSEMLSI